MISRRPIWCSTISEVRAGRSWRETDEARTTREAVMVDLLDGQYNDPVRVVAFNTAEGWARDASQEIADELRRYAEFGEVSAAAMEFIEANRH